MTWRILESVGSILHLRCLFKISRRLIEILLLEKMPWLIHLLT